MQTDPNQLDLQAAAIVHQLGLLDLPLDSKVGQHDEVVDGGPAAPMAVGPLLAALVACLVATAPPSHRSAGAPRGAVVSTHVRDVAEDLHNHKLAAVTGGHLPICPASLCLPIASDAVVARPTWRMTTALFPALFHASRGATATAPLPAIGKERVCTVGGWLTPYVPGPPPGFFSVSPGAVAEVAEVAEVRQH